MRQTRSYARFLTFFCCLSLSLATLSGQEKKKPCAGGEVRVRHAYSECRDKVWNVVEVGYFACPPNGRIEDFELSARPTAQACDKGKEGKESVPWALAGTFYKELSGDSTCQSPKKIEPVVLLECVAEVWAYSTYDLYECLDGTRRIKKPATNIDRSTTPCTQAPPRYRYNK